MGFRRDEIICCIEMWTEVLNDNPLDEEAKEQVAFWLAVCEEYNEG